MSINPLIVEGTLVLHQGALFRVQRVHPQEVELEAPMSLCLRNRLNSYMTRVAPLDPDVPFLLVPEDRLAEIDALLDQGLTLLGGVHARFDTGVCATLRSLISLALTRNTGVPHDTP